MSSCQKRPSVIQFCGMKVIITQNIKGIGRIGDIKNVADGYGRNFLLTKGLAKIATDGAMKEVETLQKKAEATEKIELEKAQQATDDLKNLPFDLTRKASPKGTLFDGIEKKDIAELITSKVGYKIDEDAVKLEEPIKHIGKHTIKIELAPKITTEIILEIKTA